MALVLILRLWHISLGPNCNNSSNKKITENIIVSIDFGLYGLGWIFKIRLLNLRLDFGIFNIKLAFFEVKLENFKVRSKN
jgi:hypothetical protein